MFDAAKGGGFGGDDAGVDADHAAFEGFGGAPDAADVATVEIGGKAVFGVVGHGDDFGFVLKTEEGGDGAEDFVLRELHVGGGFGEQGGFEEGAAFGMATAADGNRGSFGSSVGEEGFDFFYSLDVDEGALGDVGFEAVADFQFSDFGGE